jgi:hypothetical protein
MKDAIQHLRLVRDRIKFELGNTEDYIDFVVTKLKEAEDKEREEEQERDRRLLESYGDAFEAGMDIEFALERQGGGNVVVLRPVLAGVVELLLIGVGGIPDGLPQQLPRGADGNGAQHPTVVVEPSHAHHLKVLRLVSRRRIGIGFVERVGKAHASDCLAPH